MVRMSEYQYLAMNLRRYRAECGWTQAEVAQRAGESITQQYLSDLERGLRPSSVAHVEALAGALGVSASALLRRVRRRMPVAA